MKIHIANTGLHYGQSIFEGLKAFAWKDGRSVRASLRLMHCLPHTHPKSIPSPPNSKLRNDSIRIFRPSENAKRLRMSAERLLMTPFPEDMFVEAVKRVVADNAEYVPPFGSGGALYIRPLLFGSGPRIGLNPADEYTLLIMVIPVGCVRDTGGVD